MSAFTRRGVVPLFAASLAAMACAGPAHADIITALSGGAVAVAGGYAYTYNVELTGQQQLDPAGAAAIEFGTVYDFGPSFGTITATGYLAQDFIFSLDDVDAPANQTTPTDSATVANIRFTYAGSQAFSVNGSTNANSIVLPSTVDNLGTFTVDSPYGPTLDTTLQYDGQARKATNDTITGNVGYTSGPSVAVPEPAGVGLFGVALGALGLTLRMGARRPARGAAVC